jgi:predicted NUDIX family NTP pyrophosphohydrolase
MAKRSAGLLLYRRRAEGIEVLLAHPGGPFWKSKDAGAWSIPKGEYAEGEDPLAAARREFIEETGLDLPAGEPVALGEIRQPGGKTVIAWAIEGDCDPSAIRSNTFTLEWPPRSGKRAEFPEVDRAAWFPLDQARVMILQGQLPLLERLAATIP